MLEEEHDRLHNTGKHYSEKTKKKMSESKIGNHNKPTKPVLQYTKDIEFIKEWVSGTEASRVLGISLGNTTECCQRKRNSAGGFVWTYADDKLFKVSSVLPNVLNGNIKHSPISFLIYIGFL